jgi:hypothetical protein
VGEPLKRNVMSSRSEGGKFMAIWFKYAIALNLIYWMIFFWLLSRRRWTTAALLVGIFHMLFAGLVSVAPIRSTLDPHYTNFAVGFIQAKGHAAALPAALFLGWALAAAFIAVSKTKGRFMLAIAAGDLFLALNMGGSLLLDDAGDWTFQLGEYVTIGGVSGLLILLLLLTGPFVASAIWAIGRSGSGGSTTPARKTETNANDADGKTKKVNGFRYTQTRA